MHRFVAFRNDHFEFVNIACNGMKNFTVTTKRNGAL